MKYHGTEGFIYNTEKYFPYLDLVKERMPKDAYHFAKADWHYDPTDHRCPHDSWLESISITEISSGERHEIRNNIEIKILLLGSYHDGFIELIYKNVFNYILEKPAKINSKDSKNIGHGDWLTDELTLSDDGHVIHEIQFVVGKWIIESANVMYRWLPN